VVAVAEMPIGPLGPLHYLSRQPATGQKLVKPAARLAANFAKLPELLRQS
jgi:hypothetical protein